MTVLPESLIHDEDRPSDADVLQDAYCLPGILRGAAYVSAGGRAYRLFSEGEEDTRLRSLPLPLMSSPPIPEATSDTVSDTASGMMPQAIPDETATAASNGSANAESQLQSDLLQSHVADALDAIEGIEEELERLSQSAIATNATMPSVPLRESRRRRAVEGIFTGKSAGALTGRSAESAKNFPVGPHSAGTAPTKSVLLAAPSSPTLSLLSDSVSSEIRPALKLFDALPCDTLPAAQPEVALATEQVWDQVKNTTDVADALSTDGDTAATDGSEYSESQLQCHVQDAQDSPTNANASFKLIRLEIKTLRQSRWKRSREKTRPCPVSMKAECRKSEILRPPAEDVEECAESLKPELQAESLADNFLESEVERTIVESPVAENAESKVWHLHWQPTWPARLASLERQASNQVHALADHLERQFDRGNRVISFNGFRPGDGCTTLALCAARELAERGHRLLLADAHRQNPELGQLLELDIDPQHYEILTLIPGRLELLPWSESLIEIDADGQSATQETRTRSFDELIAELRAEYDAILLDGGALIECPLAERVASWRKMDSDGVLLVVNTNAHLHYAEPVNVEAVTRRLRQNGIELLGVAENYV